jgi:hypothetical protein
MSLIDAITHQIFKLENKEKEERKRKRKEIKRGKQTVIGSW